MKENNDKWHYLEEADYPIEYRQVVAIIEYTAGESIVLPICVIYVNGVWQQFNLQERSFETLSSLLGDNNYKILKWQYISY